MFHVLLESGAHAGEQRVRWTVASACVHATLIASAVMVTLPGGPRRIEHVPLDDLRYVVPRASELPARRQSGSGIVGPIARVPLEVPAIPLPFVARTSPFLGTDERLGTLMSFEPGADSAAGTGAVPGDGVYAAGFVDRAVAPLGHNVRPEYPVALRAAGVEGEVQVRFVVNSAGFVEPATIEILRATHAQFAAVVRRWLPITRYVPAEARGRRVRQLVEQRVGFTLQQ